MTITGEIYDAHLQKVIFDTKRLNISKKYKIRRKDNVKISDISKIQTNLSRNKEVIACYKKVFANKSPGFFGKIKACLESITQIKYAST